MINPRPVTAVTIPYPVVRLSIAGFGHDAAERLFFEEPEITTTNPLHPTPSCEKKEFLNLSLF
jgi:hypothetical protein